MPLLHAGCQSGFAISPTKSQLQHGDYAGGLFGLIASVV
jgi:hypothetical protein